MTLTAQFKKYLESQSLSPVSIRNYLADVRKFLEWIKKLNGDGDAARIVKRQGVTLPKNLTETPNTTSGTGWVGGVTDKRNQIPTSSDFQNYCQYLIDAQTPQQSFKRYLCSLRHFGQFLQESGLREKDPAERLESVKRQVSSVMSQEEIINDFKKALLKGKLSEVTVKNYLADTRQFLGWLGKQL